MRRVLFLAVVLTGLLCTITSFAEEATSETQPMGKMRMPMMGQDMQAKMMDMQPMHQMMMRMVMNMNMVATADGAVIVMAGNKLLKYDKDLNLVKEAEIKIDTESMEKMMQKMKEGCTVHKKMMQEEKTKEGPKKE